VASEQVLDGPVERTLCETVFPSERAYWGKP
jgi:hypothetical protein